MGDLGVSDGFWAGRRVVLTGAAGLLGGWVARRLAGMGAKVRGLDLDWPHGVFLEPEDAVERIRGDVRDAGTIASLVADSEVVIHLAAQAVVGQAEDDPVTTFEHNILGTWAVLDACRRSTGVRSVVVASSDKAYGDYGSEVYVESMPLRARNPYDASKMCADLLAQTYARSYGSPVAITRCGNLYGGGDAEWSRIVPGTIRSILRGEPPVIRSDGRFVRDYLYVEDAANGVVALAEAVASAPELAGEAFNFSAETRLTVLEAVERILEVAGSDLRPEVHSESTNEIPEQRVGAAKAHDVLQWAPAFSFDEGISRAIEWYRAFLKGPSA